MNSLFDVTLSPGTILGNLSNASRGVEAIPVAALLASSAFALTAGGVLFGSASGGITQDANLFWDNTNRRLGLFTSTPAAAFVMAANIGAVFGANVGTSGAVIDVIKNGSYNQESAGSVLALASTGISGAVKMILGVDGTNNIGFIQSMQSGTSFSNKPLALQAAGGRVLVGTITDDATNLLQVAGTGKFSTSVVTPLVGTATAIGLNFQINSSAVWQINGSSPFQFVPLVDNSYDIGQSNLRIRQVYTPIIDSGTTGPLSLKTNNGTEQVRVINNSSAVNVVFLTGASTGASPVVGSIGEAGAGLRVTSGGTGNVDFYTDNTSNLQLRLLRSTGANAVTITAATNPTISTTAGNLAITPNVLVGTNPSISGIINVPYNSPIKVRNSTNGGDIGIVNAQTINSIINLLVFGDTSASGGCQYQGRVLAATAPTTSDIPAGFFTVWNDNTTAKLYYNLGGTLKSVALA